MAARWIAAVAVVCAVSLLYADGPSDNVAEKVRPVPPPGIAVDEAEQTKLKTALTELASEIANLRKVLDKKPLLAMLPDVQIFHDAVRYALVYNEFYDKKELTTASNLLKAGLERAKSLREGKAPWATASGLIVRGYVSKIDGSVQPYGLVVPASYKPDVPHRFRLDLWAHGRGEKLTELSFLDGRMRSPGEFTPANAFVLHLYGRYCNANKLAGEIDALEAMAHVKSQYPIDENRVVIRGFSMGGAACWQFAVHYPSLWAAAAPGAGFAETAKFLNVFQKETVQPTEYEKKLYHIYDCTDYAANLFNLPIVAYSGEKDSQKQAADVMAEAMAKEGLDLMHIIGPGTGHAYHPAAKKELNEKVDAIVARGRNPLPRHVRFTTWTTRYNESFWVKVDGLSQHWDQGIVDAQITGSKSVKLDVRNVSALTLSMKSGLCPFDGDVNPTLNVTDGQRSQTITAPRPKSDRSWSVSLVRADNGTWSEGTQTGLTKHHGLQGPIDDAFLDSFLMVKPSGIPLNDKVGAWVTAESKHAIDQWRSQFRGEARVKDDKDVTAADIESSNLILWGDPSSNKLIASILEKLPVKWDNKQIALGQSNHDASHSMPVMIYPNPLNPKRYVVLNSGFTFREYDYLNNARQIPKLPDFAVIDVRTPSSARWPGKVAQAGFFDEKWQLSGAKK